MSTFTTSSKYATLTPYMLLEYMYADQPTPETYPVNSGLVTVGFDKLVNGYISNDIQIFNPLVDSTVTNNTVNNSVVRIDQSNYVTLDSNLIIPFNDFDDKLTNTNDLPITFPSNINVVYDTVRFHIRAGYNLSNLDGVIVSIKYEDQDNSYVTVASILIKKGTQQVYTLNTKPVTIGSDIYDKYVEIKIPNLLDMQNKYMAASPGNKPNTLAGKISKSGNGFNNISPIRISVDEVKSITDYNGYAKYGTQNVATFPLSQEDPFKDIGAIIRPSDNGEFFEYFATDNGGFIEDFILFQNSIGNSYYIYHQIEVLEQIGAAFIETSNFSNIQTNAYDVPNLFRPIIRNSSVANSFVLRYTMSLVNNADQTRVIRIGTYTSNKPGRYGTRITPLSISQDPQMYKIYNKIYDQPSINMINLQQKETTVKEIVKYSNIFIQQNRVTTSVTNLVAKTNAAGTVSLSPEQGQSEEVIYGKGNAIIEISPFDNYYKFLFYVNGSDGIPNLIDLESSGSYKLVFIDNKGAKLKIPSIVDKNIANPAKGELAFKIGEDVSSKILQFSDRKYYISNIPMDSNDSLVSEATSVAVPFSGVTEISYKGTKTLSLKRDNSNTSVKAQSVTIEPKKRNAVTDVTSSVLYWGKWKKEGEEVTQTPIVIPRGNTPTYATIPSYRNRAIPGLSSDRVVKNSSVKSVKPVSGSAVTVSTSPNITPVATATLTGSALISAVSTLIYSFDSTGWTPQQIYTYFFVPGNPGYVTYPNLTQSQFEQAANGILSSSDLSLLFSNTNVVSNQTASSTAKATQL